MNELLIQLICYGLFVIISTISLSIYHLKILKRDLTIVCFISFLVCSMSILLPIGILIICLFERFGETILIKGE